ncbi:MAG TPA: PAS domain-containing protein, partial [Planctomycetota bacterium]|nr:PAS domain-containing protein [Planctomycetota bacterium]
VESVRKGIVGEHETLVSLLENRGGSDNGDAEPGAQLVSVREAVDALRSEVERVALATDGAFASRLDSIEENLSRIASRSEEEPAPAPAVAEEWKAQAAALRKEIEDARALAEELLADLESARTTETALRAELEEIRRREGELDERLQAEVRARAETSARETLLAERAAELEKSERLARSELAQLRAAASAETRDSESGGDARDDERLLLLELELEEARAQGEAHSRRMGELEAEAQSLRESRDQLEQELSESRSALEAAENAIRGSERLAEKAGELESFIGELEKEREALHDQKIELEGQLRIARLENEELRANLDAQAAKAADQPVGASDIERLRGEVADIQDFQSALVQGDLSVALIAVDPELQVFVWNPAAERLFGIPSAEALGRSFYELGAGAADLVARLADEAKQSIKTGSPRSLDPRHFALRDREVWLDLRCEPITSSRDDRCLGALLAVSNVTENVENKVRLDAQERFLENLSRSIPVALVITDDRRRVVVWNRNAERILKLSRSEALGRDLLSLRCRLSESNFRDDFLAAEKAGKATRFHVAADTDEVQARYLVTFAPFRDDAEKRCGHLLLIERAAPTKVVSPQER